MRIFRRTAITAFLVVAVSFVTPWTDAARAADPVESITLSPTSKTYKVEAGQTFEDSLTILNDGQTAYDFTVYAGPYSVTSGSYDPNFTSTAANADAYTWIQFKQTTWHAEPRETLKIPYTVHVKKDASPGGHYGVLFAEVQPSTGAGESTLARKKRVGAIVYATVNGDVHLSGEKVTTSIPWFQSSAPLKVVASVKNTGNSDFTTRVTYEVSDVFGSVKYNLQSDYVILPSTTRDMTLSWADAPWFGLYKARVTTTFLETTSVVESYVLIMPIWLVLLVSGMVVAGGAYAGWRRSHRTRH
jgi:hypothetical protein